MSIEPQLTEKNFVCPKCSFTAVAASKIWVRLHLESCNASFNLKHERKRERQKKRKRIIIKNTQSVEAFKEQRASEGKPPIQVVRASQASSVSYEQQQAKFEASLKRMPKDELIERVLRYRKHIQRLEKALKASRQKRKPAHVPHEFYDSKPWRDLRFKVLKKYGRTCALCLTTSGPMHVDHIKPRSLFPDLELVEGNLQILCEACNLGKSKW